MNNNHSKWERSLFPWPFSMANEFETYDDYMIFYYYYIYIYIHNWFENNIIVDMK